MRHTLNELHMKYISYTSARPPGLLRKAAAIVTTAAVAAALLMFSAALLAVILVAGTLGAGYLWWKTRGLRRQMRNFPARGAPVQSEAFTGEIIEGEVIRVDDGSFSRK